MITYTLTLRKPLANNFVGGFLILLYEQAGVRRLRGRLKWEGNLDEQRHSRSGER